jgi:prolipoprotein diacylglyceryltransferase
VGRFLIEGLRLDSFWVGSFRVAQLASVAGVVIALAGVAWSLRRPPIDAGSPATGRAPGRRARRPRG